MFILICEIMLSRTSEYALRAVAFLASEQGRPCTVREAAEAIHVPVGYLAKVLQQLSRAELVSSRRGLGGGFVLTRAPADVSVLEVVNAVDPIRRIVHCPLGLREHATALCALHRKLDDAYAAVEAAFAGSTVDDLVGAPPRRGAPPAWPVAARPAAAARRGRARAGSRSDKGARHGAGARRKR
jgi:Rrf2 family protein